MCSVRRSDSCGREDYVDYFIGVKRRGVAAAHNQITQWELRHYLQLF